MNKSFVKYTVTVKRLRISNQLLQLLLFLLLAACSGGGGTSSGNGGVTQSAPVIASFTATPP